jgi:hypothetical protein
MRASYFLTAAVSITLVSSCARGRHGDVGAADTAAMAPSFPSQESLPTQESLPRGQQAPNAGAPVQAPTQELAPRSGDSARRM